MWKTREMLEIEAREGRDIRAVMRDAYRTHGSALKAAQSMGISQGAFSTWTSVLSGRIDSNLVFDDFPEDQVSDAEAAAA